MKRKHWQRKKNRLSALMSEQADKIQKILAGLGLASRREAEEWIRQGRVTLNGEIATLGQRASVDDTLLVDNEKVKLTNYYRKQVAQVFIYNKPLGEECSKKPSDDRKSVFERFPKGERWILVGRLDVNTSGLLLVTNHGELANRLMHPSYEVNREYCVRVDGKLRGEQFEQMLAGVDVDGYVAKFDAIETLKKAKARNHWYKVSLHTGRNREVRRLLGAVGVSVSRLIRTEFANVALPRSINPGHHKFLDADNVKKLFELVNLDHKI